jgi:hypothetical protein
MGYSLAAVDHRFRGIAGLQKATSLIPESASAERIGFYFVLCNAATTAEGLHQQSI